MKSKKLSIIIIIILFLVLISATVLVAVTEATRNKTDFSIYDPQLDNFYNESELDFSGYSVLA
jgi:flagellar basal body-associated protein FliL